MTRRSESTPRFHGIVTLHRFTCRSLALEATRWVNAVFRLLRRQLTVFGKSTPLKAGNSSPNSFHKILTPAAYVITTSVEAAVATSLPVPASTSRACVKAIALPQRSTTPVAT